MYTRNWMLTPATSWEKRLMGCVGVDCAEFDRRSQPHAMMVKYDPDEMQGMQILNIVRTVDPVASRVGL